MVIFHCNLSCDLHKWPLKIPQGHGSSLIRDYMCCPMNPNVKLNHTLSIKINMWRSQQKSSLTIFASGAHYSEAHRVHNWVQWACERKQGLAWISGTQVEMCEWMQDWFSWPKEWEKTEMEWLSAPSLSLHLQDRRFPQTHIFSIPLALLFGSPVTNLISWPVNRSSLSSYLKLQKWVWLVHFDCMEL